MKTQLSFALFFCLLHCSFANVMEEPDDFCDQGPPGKYCLPNLYGWHDCHLDPSTGKVVDKIYSCPSNTRCACFYGPACPGYLDDPCQPYRLPPPTPPKYTLYYNIKQTDCSPVGCHVTYSSGRELQTLTEHKKRYESKDETYLKSMFDVNVKFPSAVFVLPAKGGGFSKTQVSFDDQTCDTQLIKTFPKSQIPPYVSYNGTVKIGDRLCEQWIYKGGGHNAGEATALISYYISHQTSEYEKRYPADSGVYADRFIPVMLEFFYNSGPVGKTSFHIVKNITSFIEEVDEELLELPSFC